MAMAYYDRAIFYRSQGQYFQAEADLEKAKGLFYAQSDIDGYTQTMSVLRELQWRSETKLDRLLNFLHPILLM